MKWAREPTKGQWDIVTWIGSARAEMERTTPLHRLAMPKDVAEGCRRRMSPEDVVGVAVWLASDLASYVTGAAVVVNGGLLRA